MRAITLAAGLLLPLAASAEDYAAWPLLTRSFESTGGAGVIIGEYEPVVLDDRCVTRFSATLPSGEVFRNVVMFDAVPEAGGTLCTRGRWRSLDGEARGTTPLRVWWKDGVARRSP